MSSKPPPVTVATAAHDLNVSVHTVRSWIAQRRLGHLKLGRAVRVPVSEIERLLQKGFVPSRRS